MARPLKTSGVSQISVVTSFEAEEPVSALLETIYEVTPTIYADLEKQHSIVTAYVRASPSALRSRQKAVETGLRELSGMGISLGSGEILIRPVRREDWAESWKKHFKPIEIGGSLIIKPSWSKQQPKPNQAVVVLDPGLSFGTGQHATTSFCLKQLVRIVRKAKGEESVSFLDMGSGSGILSIAAAKLGCAPVMGFDFDPVAVRVALKNCRVNRVERKVTIARKDLTRLPLRSRTRFDLICANLISTLLLAEKERILNRLAPGGTLVLAGILATEFPEVAEAYQAAGLRLIKTTAEREWQSGAFELS